MLALCAEHALVPLLLLGSFGALGGALLAQLAQRNPPLDSEALLEAVLDQLPQTQCGYCGHAGCRPYAAAILSGDQINKCPPGGSTTIAALASLLGRPALPLDPAHGIEQAPAVAFIREPECIGCTLCIQACPVDAIIGAPGQMHTVITEQCTGCDLCVEPCPVDCIDMRPLSATAARQRRYQALPRARRARQRYEQRQQRLHIQDEARRSAKAQRQRQRQGHFRSLADRQRLVAAAVERVRAKKLGGAGAHRAAIEAAITRAERSALHRESLAESAAAMPNSQPPGEHEIRRQIGVYQRKLLRAQQKLAAAEIEGAKDMIDALIRSISSHEKQLEELQQQLAALVSAQVPQ